jgi:hypothetical protein
MDPTTPLWTCLEKIRSLRLIAHSHSATGWQGSGSGTVTVERAESLLICRETGTWQPQGGRPSRFRNTWRWSQPGSGWVRLEHLRFGPQHPVHLLDLAPVGGGGWQSVSPHLCGEDCYSAHLQLEDTGLRMGWIITGPHKSEQIQYAYSWDPAAQLEV